MQSSPNWFCVCVYVAAVIESLSRFLYVSLSLSLLFSSPRFRVLGCRMPSSLPAPTACQRAKWVFIKQLADQLDSVQSLFLISFLLSLHLQDKGSLFSGLLKKPPKTPGEVTFPPTPLVHTPSLGVDRLSCYIYFSLHVRLDGALRN